MKASKKFPLFQPATLPAVLMEMHQALATAASDGRRRDAALEIIHEYFRFFGATGMRQDMWQLLTGALGNKHMRQLRKVSQRNNLLFFYEFTLMLIDASNVISEVTRNER